MQSALLQPITETQLKVDEQDTRGRHCRTTQLRSAPRSPPWRHFEVLGSVARVAPCRFEDGRDERP